MGELSADARDNRDDWTKANAEYTDAQASDRWAREHIEWGMWDVPESELGILGDVAGLDVVELGCGTAYFSAWLARRGARPVGVDVTPAQLATARRCQEETGHVFPLVEADAVSTGLADASFDLALSEYGASIWCDPFLWIPEAHRLLRPGGRLVFLRNSTLVILCSPDTDEPAGTTLQRPQRGMHRFSWPDSGVEFHLGHGDWIALLRDTGFDVMRLVELFAPEGSQSHPYYDFVSADWARQWPSEEIWVAGKR
jgi:SAM-dependent methyltransferase